MLKKKSSHRVTQVEIHFKVKIEKEVIIERKLKLQMIISTTGWWPFATMKICPKIGQSRFQILPKTK